MPDELEDIDMDAEVAACLERETQDGPGFESEDELPPSDIDEEDDQ